MASGMIMNNDIIDKIITGTTSASGNIILNESGLHPISAIVLYQSTVQFAFISRLSGTELIHVTDSNMNPISNTEVSVRVFFKKAH